MIARKDIEAAYTRIRRHVRRTPVVAVDDKQLCPAGSVWLKLEQLQHTGSFKPRGVFNSILGARMPASGVVAVSGGNHGAAVGFAAAQLNLPSLVFVPKFAGEVKIDRMRSFGAKVEVRETMAEAFRGADQYREERGAIFIHPWDQVGTIEGQGTVGLELGEQVPELDTLLVAVGGGGLIGGIAAFYDGRIRIIGVESEGTATLAVALESGRDSTIVAKGIAASALGAPQIGELGYALARQYVDTTIVVSDEAIIQAQRKLWAALRIIGEPGGVTALAALTSGKYSPKSGERIGVVLCGGNAEPGWFL